MDREWKELIEKFGDYNLGLEIITSLLAYIRKYHRRIGAEKIRDLANIVLEVLTRDVEFYNMENFIVDNFDYFNFIFLNIADKEASSFKDIVFTSDFNIRDLKNLLIYILGEVENLNGDLDFLLRLIEKIFEKNIRLKNLNEFNPNRKKWVGILCG